MGAMNAYVAAAAQLAGALAAAGRARRASRWPLFAARRRRVLLVPLAAGVLGVEGPVRACSACVRRRLRAGDRRGRPAARRRRAAVRRRRVRRGRRRARLLGPVRARPARGPRRAPAARGLAPLRHTVSTLQRPCGASSSPVSRCSRPPHRRPPRRSPSSPFTATPGDDIATCLRPTGAPGGLAQIGPLGRRTTATDLLRVTGGGTASWDGCGWAC